MKFRPLSHVFPGDKQLMQQRNLLVEQSHPAPVLFNVQKEAVQRVFMPWVVRTKSQDSQSMEPR